MFDGLYHAHALHVWQRRRSGVGVIFMFHRVAPPDTPVLASDLVARSAFLDRMLGYVRELGWDVISLSEGHRRLIENKGGPNFACFTFDDGYSDVLSVALPIFQKHGAPICVYLTTGLIERKSFLWWPVLEQMILNRDRVTYVSEGGEDELHTRTLEEKRSAYWKLSPLAYARHARSHAELTELFRCNGVDPVKALDPLILNWSQARELAADPLVEIGCHTVSHPALASLEYSEASRELAEARRLLEERLGVPVHHLSYPYGTRTECSTREFQLAHDLGFHTATTARRGNVFPAHRDHLTALPRVNVPGVDSASLRFIRKCLFGDSLWPSHAPALVTD